MQELISEVTDAVLGQTFDAPTLQRARAYADSGHVHDTRVNESAQGLRIHANVAGTRATPYSTTVAVQHRAGHTTLATQCSCPVGFACKHAAAAVISHRRAAREELLAAGGAAASGLAVPPWRRQLESMLAGLEQQDSAAPVRQRALALQFELRAPSRGRYSTRTADRLFVRPVMQGARDNWVKTGIDWHQVQQVHRRDEFDPDQSAALGSVASTFGGGSARDALDLADAGASLWPLLQRAREAGVEFDLTGRASGLEILDDPLSLTADLVETAEGQRVVLGVTHDQRFWSGDSMILLGRHPHGVAVLVPGEERPRFDRAAPHIVLAPLTRVAPEAVRRLHLGDHGLVVPAQDQEMFRRDYVPRLRQQVRLTSSDGSVDLPEEVPPRLQLLVFWQSSTRVSLTWRWAYDVEGADRIFGLHADPSALATRRPRLERRLLEGLELDDMAGSLLCDRVGRLTEHQVLDDLWALLFADAVLPGLLDGEQVEVVEEGDRPDYREATGDLEIEFAVAEPGEEQDEHTDWLDLEVVITIEGEQVSLPIVLEALTRGRERIILPSGLHVPTDRPEFSRLAELVAAAGDLHEQERDGVRVSRHDLGLWGELAELGIVDQQAAQWVAAAQALAHQEGLPDVDPVGLKSELRSYQRDGFRWLACLWQAGLGGILADDMGLGKTLQTLALVSHARAQGADRFLVVAPTSVMSAWAHEAATHAPGLDVRVVDASAARRGTPLEEAVEGADIVITSYTLFRLEAEGYAAMSWGGLVLDEAQAIKNHNGKTYQAVRRLEVPFRLAVTGTPFENRLMELWALLSVVAPGLYPWPRRFSDTVVKPVERYGDQAALDRFRRRIRPFLLRRTKGLVAADLPAKQEQVVEVTLGAKHRRIYDTHLQRERQAILGLVEDFERNRVAIFSSLTRLRQLSLDPGLIDAEHDAVGSAKLDALAAHLHELVAEGHRALVFSSFTGFLTRARERLAREGITSRYLDGTTRNRASEIEAFKSGDADAFLISLKAGGVGLTLTEADYVFVLDPWWNPATEAQAVDRAHRIGQERSVMVYRLVATGTIEEKVMELKERKAALFSSVFEGTGAVGTGIDAEDVRSLFDE